MPKLIHTRDGKFIGELKLAEGRWMIGRRPESHIFLDDTTVSGKHALVIVTQSKYLKGLLDVHVEDQGSTNGTRVNGKVIKRHLLKHNEIMKIADHEFTFIDEATRGFETTTVELPDN